VTAAIAPVFQRLVTHEGPPSSRMLRTHSNCAVWRIRRKRKGVKHVLKLFAYADSLRRNEDGQTMAEYGVVLAVITLAIITTLALLGTNVEAKIGDVVEALG
jgi:pilus assembly protein Flp/PilA